MKVNYVGKAANIYSTGYELKGSAYVISKYISNTWLWDRVRVSGGAYGGFCDFDTHSGNFVTQIYLILGLWQPFRSVAYLLFFTGVFSFLSYRDPNLLKTLDVYDGTGEFLRQLDMDKDTLTKAIIGTIGDVDSYQLPDAKGYSRLVLLLILQLLTNCIPSSTNVYGNRPLLYSNGHLRLQFDAIFTRNHGGRKTNKTRRNIINKVTKITTLQS